jgi:hypothetical protein
MPYTERYVAFADILGFSAIVKQTESDQTSARFDALASALEGIGSFDGDVADVGADFQYQTFSDSIVLSTEATAPGMIVLLSCLSELSLRLLTGSGLLLRGAVSKGKLYHRGAVMFGPAFLEAYSIEKSIANFRVSF